MHSTGKKSQKNSFQKAAGFTLGHSSNILSFGRAFFGECCDFLCRQAEVVTLFVVHLSAALNVELLRAECAGVGLALEVDGLDVPDQVGPGHIVVGAAQAQPTVPRDLLNVRSNLFFCNRGRSERDSQIDGRER